MKTAWARKQNGFTLIELIIVIVVIGILASIIYVSFTVTEQRSRDAQRDRDIFEVQRALEKYYADNGTYPSVGSDNTGYPLSSLTLALTPTYISQIPTAPSAVTYQYVRGAPSTGSYGIEMNYESKPNCHRGVNNQGVGWWSLQACVQ